MKQLVIHAEKWIFQAADINSLMTINYLNKKSFPVDHHSPTRNFPIKLTVSYEGERWDVRLYFSDVGRSGPMSVSGGGGDLGRQFEGENRRKWGKTMVVIH